MLQLTDAAKERLHKSLTAAALPKNEGKCYRVVPNDEKHLTLRLARPAPSDETFSHDGRVVLALPKALRPYLRNKSLDIDSSGQLKFC